MGREKRVVFPRPSLAVMPFSLQMRLWQRFDRSFHAKRDVHTSLTASSRLEGNKQQLNVDLNLSGNNGSAQMNWNCQKMIFRELSKLKRRPLIKVSASLTLVILGNGSASMTWRPFREQWLSKMLALNESSLMAQQLDDLRLFNLHREQSSKHDLKALWTHEALSGNNGSARDDLKELVFPNGSASSDLR